MFLNNIKNQIDAKSITFIDVCLVLFALLLPISTALSSIFYVLILVVAPFQPDYLKSLKQIIHLPAIVFLLLFAGWMVIGFIYPNVTLNQIFINLKSVLKILAIPLLAPLFNRKNLYWVVWGFVFSMLLTVLLSLLQLLPQLKISFNPYYSPGAIFKNHITTSIFMAFSCFVASDQIFSETNSRKKKFLSLILFLLFFFHLLFLNYGRSGYIICAALWVLFFVQRFNLKGIVLGLLSGLIIAVCIFKFSTNFHDRMHTASQEYYLYTQQGMPEGGTSTGLRLEFWKNSIDLIKQKPLFGWGTGTFEQAYQAIPAKHKICNVSNPHNQFLLIAVERGIIGLFLFLGLLVCCGWASLSLPKDVAYFFQGVLVTFIVGSMGNSLLLDHTEGLFFVLFCAWAFSTAGRSGIDSIKTLALRSSSNSHTP